MRLTIEEVREIAADAYHNAGYNITDYVGYYTIWSDGDGNDDYAVAINKEHADEYTKVPHYAIYVSPPVDEEGWWEGTDTLTIEDLSVTLMQIMINIDINRYVKEVN